MKSSNGSRLAPPGSAVHAGVPPARMRSNREIRLYMARGEADRVRARANADDLFAGLRCSPLYRIPGGWGWTMWQKRL